MLWSVLSVVSLPLCLFTSSRGARSRAAVGMLLAAAPIATHAQSIGMANLGANQVTLRLTSSASGTGYFTLLAGAGATCGTAAQTKTGQNSAGAAAFRFGSLPLTAAVTGTYTVKNLMASTRYTVCFTPDGSAAPVAANVTTTAAAPLSTAAWTAVGSADFSAGELTSSRCRSPRTAPYVAYSDEQQ